MDIIGEENKSSLMKSRDGIPTPKEIRKNLDDPRINNHAHRERKDANYCETLCHRTWFATRAKISDTGRIIWPCVGGSISSVNAVQHQKTSHLFWL
jgi:hypothetical protein